MQWHSIVILIIIGILAFLAIFRSFFSRKKKKGCGGGCAGCNIQDCPSRKKEENSKE